MNEFMDAWERDRRVMETRYRGTIEWFLRRMSIRQAQGYRVVRFEVPETFDEAWDGAFLFGIPCSRTGRLPRVICQ